MARKRFVVKASEEQALTWGGGVWVLGCRTVEDFLARCADVVCQRIERFAPRIEREEERKRRVRVRERLERDALFFAALDAARKGEG